ncbi:hypothetical protein GEV33_003177 [Tenebrio molitor]|uniref:Uncharacterized protein n=1 Tax=Tenebrio molitor TaxID=7067 RepID=A0A8J6HRQ0_TENMO|nr:hypothetical protein GEV33_003177 [Tenebrio molitor]
MQYSAFCATGSVIAENLLEKCFCKPRNATSAYCYDLNRRAIVYNVLESIATETYSDSPKNLRIEGMEAINRGNQRRKRDFSRPFAGGVGRRDVGSCQSRSSPDSPEGAGSTHQQVRSSGDTPFFYRPWLLKVFGAKKDLEDLSAYAGGVAE